MNRKLICIVCPIGCSLEILHDEHEILSLQGNLCARGEEYAEKELFHPERILTTSVRVMNGEMPLASVRSKEPIPKGIIRDVVSELKGIQQEAPVKFGQVVMKDISGTGVDIVVTREVKRKT